MLCLKLGAWYIDRCNFDLQTFLESSRVPVTLIGKGMGKNSCPYMGMGKLVGKYFFVGKGMCSTYPVGNYQ